MRLFLSLLGAEAAMVLAYPVALRLFGGLHWFIPSNPPMEKHLVGWYPNDVPPGWSPGENVRPYMTEQAWIALGLVGAITFVALLVALPVLQHVRELDKARWARVMSSGLLAVLAVAVLGASFALLRGPEPSRLTPGMCVQHPRSPEPVDPRCNVQAIGR